MSIGIVLVLGIGVMVVVVLITIGVLMGWISEIGDRVDQEK